jgi:hypothetical protein
MDAVPVLLHAVFQSSQVLLFSLYSYRTTTTKILHVLYQVTNLLRSMLC